jgi:hypothetical protein
MLVEYAQRPSSAWWQLWLDDVREVPLIHVRSDLELAAGHAYRRTVYGDGSRGLALLAASGRCGEQSCNSCCIRPPP